MSDLKYKIKFIGNEKSDHVKYFMDVTSIESSKTWTKKERYSKIRQMHLELRKEVGNRDMPTFPSRRWWGNLNDGFISQRQHELENYFSTISATPAFVKTSAFQTFINTDKIVRDADDTQNQTIFENSIDIGRSGTLTIQGDQYAPYNIKHTKKFQNALAKACNNMLENANGMFIDLSSNPNPIEEDALNERENYYVARLPTTMKGSLTGYGKHKGVVRNLEKLHDPSAVSVNVGVFNQFEKCFRSTNEILKDDALFTLEGENIIHTYNQKLE